jgi:hypothetical protein
MAIVVCAVLCTHAVAMLSNEEVVKLTKGLKVFTYDLVGAGLMPPLETFSMQSPLCKECDRPLYPQWTECNYGLGTAQRSPIVSDYQGYLWHGGEDSSIYTHYRLTHSSFATTNASEAQLFFIPIYPLLHERSKPDPVWYCGPLLLEYADYTRLWGWLRNQTSYKNSDGANHFIMVAHPWGHAKRWPLFKSLGLENAGLSPEAMSAERAKFGRIAKLVVDVETDDPGRYSGHLSAEDEEAPTKFLRDLESEQKHPDSAFQVPYLTGIHYIQASSPWSQQLTIPTDDTAGGEERLVRHIRHERPVLASYITTIRVGQDPETEYLAVKRKVLVLCVNAPECKVQLMDPGTQEKSFKRILRHVNRETSVLSTLGFKGVQNLLESGKSGVETLYYLSKFCLMPPGDTVSRKGLFDAILMGCIPVVFYPNSAYYRWHLPVGDGPEGLESFAVYIPAKDVLKNHTIVMDHLRSIPKQRVRAMQKQLAALAPRIQYAATLEEAAEIGRLGTPRGRTPDALEIALAELSLYAKRV